MELQYIYVITLSYCLLILESIQTNNATYGYSFIMLPQAWC